MYSKLSSTRSDGLHFPEEEFKIIRNIYFALQKNYLFMRLKEEEEVEEEEEEEKRRNDVVFLDALSE